MNYCLNELFFSNNLYIIIFNKYKILLNVIKYIFYLLKDIYKGIILRYEF